METSRSRTSHGPTGRLRTEDTGENREFRGPRGQKPRTVPQGGFALRTPARTELSRQKSPQDFTCGLWFSLEILIEF